MTSENERLREVYGDYERDASTRKRWDPSAPGNVEISRERQRVARDMLAAHGSWPPRPLSVLEIGCGGGRVMMDLHAAGAPVDSIVGVDLIADRVARSDLVGAAPLLVGDAVALPAADATFDVVMAFTVFSSILDDAVSTAIAREADRVLVPGGVVLVYDFRYPSPRNRNTVRVTPADLRALFPGYRSHSRTLSFVPPIARRLGRLATVAYRPLAAVPFLRTHAMSALTKPR